MAEDQTNNQQDEEDDVTESTFDDQIQYFARELVIDAHDIGDAYKDRPDSLKAYFNARSGHEGTAAVIFFGLAVSAIAVLLKSDAPILNFWPLIVTAPLTGLGAWGIGHY